MEFNVGDIVEVKNWGKQYTNNTPWFEAQLAIDKNFLLNWVVRFAYDNDNYDYYKNKKDDRKFKILHIGREDEYAIKKALITPMNDSEDSHTYLIGMEGLNPIRKKITRKQMEQILQERVEEILGYPIEVIDDVE